MRDVSFLRTRADRLATEIAETEKAFGEAKAKKETLEARVKQIEKDLPDLRAELAVRIERNQKYPTAATDQQVSETRTQITKLEREKDQEIPAALGKVNKEIENLKLRLEEVYDQIQPTIPPERVIDAAQRRSGECPRS